MTKHMQVKPRARREVDYVAVHGDSWAVAGLMADGSAEAMLARAYRLRRRRTVRRVAAVRTAALLR
jgi:hypothetical protein